MTTTPEALIADLVEETEKLLDLTKLNADPAMQTLADHTDDLNALGPVAGDIETAANNIAAIQAAPGHAADAAAARDIAVANAGLGAVLADAVRAQYSILTRPPSVVIDPVRNTYFGAGGPQSFTDLVAYVRNSAATFVDASGQLKSAPADTPRLGGHVLKDGMFQRAGLRVDQQSTNLMKYSEDFTGGPGWGFGSLASLVDVTAPDGSNSAKEITGTTGSVSYLGQVTTVTPGFSTFSVFAKAGTDNIICLRPHGYDATPNNTVWFDVAAGAILTQSADIHTAEIQDTGDGWFRCSVTFETTSDLTGFLYVYLCDGDGSLIASGGSVLLWGAQAEAGGTPTSYIKTEAAQVTRAGDVITIPAANMPIATNGMTVVFEGAVDWADTNSVDARLFHWGDAVPEIIALAVRQTGGHVASVAASGYKAGWAESGNALAPFNEFGEGLGRTIKAALRMTPTEVQAVLNGTAYTAAALPNGMPDPSSVAADILQNFNGTLSLMRIFDAAMPEAALIQETSL